MASKDRTRTDFTRHLETRPCDCYLARCLHASGLITKLLRLLLVDRCVERSIANRHLQYLQNSRHNVRFKHHLPYGASLL